jgi:hypothetical protein
VAAEVVRVSARVTTVAPIAPIAVSAIVIAPRAFGVVAMAP